MAQTTMYPAKAGSTQTTITAVLSDSATSIAVAELSAFPAVGTEGGNLVTFWDDNGWETCLYTAKSSASGAGTLTITRSGVGHDSSTGGGIEWPSGTKCARLYTAYDHTAAKANIEEHESRLVSAEGDIDALQSAPPAHKTSHQSGGTDAIKLDDLSAPDDNTDLNVSTSAHGLCPKLPNDASKFLDGSGSYRKVTSSDAGAASSTTATQSIYVDNAATGTGTGVSWTDAFTSIQAAVNSLPAIINHAVTILVRKGATPYRETVTVQRAVVSGSIEIRGEYYWNNQAASNSTANRLVKNDSDDFTNVSVGDVVCLYKFSGTYDASYPDQSYYGTVTDITNRGSGYVTIAMNNTAGGASATVTPTTGWKYVILRTEISGSDDGTTKTRDHILVNPGISSSVILTGIILSKCKKHMNGDCNDPYISGSLTISSCFVDSCDGGVFSLSGAINISDILFRVSPSSATLGRVIWVKNTKLTQTRVVWIDMNGYNGAGIMLNYAALGDMKIIGISNGAGGASGIGISVSTGAHGYTTGLYISNKISEGINTSYAGRFAGITASYLNSATVPKNPASNPADVSWIS